MLGKLLGRLRCDRTPEVNSGLRLESATGVKPLTMEEMMRRYIREEVSRSAELSGEETFEEADDFEEEDPEVIPLTHHQVLAMTDSELREEALSGYGIDLVDEANGSPSPAPNGEPAQGDQAPQETNTPPT